ncbi:MAG TPA: L,D-transpeptidase [Euzebyales bacterium]|nr:L,D-transpeptidase [Euzebyales bacterium]
MDVVRGQRGRSAAVARLLLVIGLTIALVGLAPLPAQAASTKTVRAVQKHLTRLGIKVAIDGIEGPETRQGACAARRLLGHRAVNRASVTTADLRALRNRRALPKPQHGSSYLSVDQTCQMVYQARGGRWKRIMKASTGVAGHRTPNGSYRVQWRWPGWHNSSAYPSDRREGNMYNSLYFRGGGYAIHGSRSVPYQPASHGCVRISVANADRIFDEVPNGLRVFVYGSP